MPEPFADALKQSLGSDRIRENVSLADFTTFRIGGPADTLYEARSADEIVSAVTSARDLGIPYFLLGLGANILIGDLGIRGLVIRNRADGLFLDMDRGELTAESGAIVWPNLIETLVEAGLSGFEHFAGIPSTLGGALWQNLHFLSPAPERERTVFLDEVVSSAELLTPESERITVDREYFKFGYDTSVLHYSGDIALSGTFALEHRAPDEMRRIIHENLAWRAERHPPLDTEPSAGSIFKKIEGVGAGRLIESCGLKGKRIGGIEITHRHANIMINRGGGRAEHVRAMIELTIETVLRETGYQLEPEIAFVGEFA